MCLNVSRKFRPCIVERICTLKKHALNFAIVENSLGLAAFVRSNAGAEAVTHCIHEELQMPIKFSSKKDAVLCISTSR